MKKTAAIAGLAAMTLLDISAATPVAAQNADAFSGGYVGAHFGGIFSDTNFTGPAHSVTGLPSDTSNVYPVPARNENYDLAGILAGLHTGFNVVTNGNFMYGIEGDWTYLNAEDTVSFNSGRVDIAGGGGDGVIFQHRSEIELEWQGTIRGRAGFIAGNTLFFATAGIAFLNASWNDVSTVTDCGQVCSATDATFTNVSNDDGTLIGAVIGAGVEVAIAPNVTIGGDYLYENFGEFGSVPFGHIGEPHRGRIDDFDVHKVRVRVSVKFGGPAQ